MSLGEHAPPACGCCPACRPKIVPWASAGRHYGCFAGERYAHAGRNLKILDHEHAMGSEPAFEWFGEFPELVNRKLGWPIGTPPWREPSKPGFPGTVEYTLWPRRGNSWVSSSVSEPSCRGTGGTSGRWNRTISVDLRRRDRGAVLRTRSSGEGRSTGFFLREGSLWRSRMNSTTQCPHVIDVFLDRLRR